MPHLDHGWRYRSTFKEKNFHVSPAKVKWLFITVTNHCRTLCLWRTHTLCVNGIKQMTAETGGDCYAFHSWPHTVTVYIQTDTAEAAGRRLYQQLKCFPPRWCFSLRSLLHVASKLHSPHCRHHHHHHQPIQSLDSASFVLRKKKLDVSFFFQSL